MVTKTFLKTIAPLFLFAALLTIGCSKKSDTATTKNPALLIINTSPDASPLGLYVNSGTIFDSLPFTTTYGYFQLGQGFYSMQFFRTDTTTNYLQDTLIDANNDTTYINTDSILYRATTLVTLDTANITVQPDSAYSLFLIDSASKLKSVFIPDHLADSAGGSPKLRFFNFSPNAPAVDLAVSGGGQVLFSNRSFNDVSSNPSLAAFSPTGPGTFNLEVRLAGTTTVVATLTGVSFVQGKLYTLYAKGFYGGTGTQAFGIGVIRNN